MPLTETDRGEILQLADRYGQSLDSHVCKWFLKNDPQYGEFLTDVWLWDEWPGRQGREVGVALVAKAKNGGHGPLLAGARDRPHRTPCHFRYGDSSLGNSHRDARQPRCAVVTWFALGSDGHGWYSRPESGRP